MPLVQAWTVCILIKVFHSLGLGSNIARKQVNTVVSNSIPGGPRLCKSHLFWSFYWSWMYLKFVWKIRCVWFGLELNRAELWPSGNWVWDHWVNIWQREFSLMNTFTKRWTLGIYVLGKSRMSLVKTVHKIFILFIRINQIQTQFWYSPSIQWPHCAVYVCETWDWVQRQIHIDPNIRRLWL